MRAVIKPLKSFIKVIVSPDFQKIASRFVKVDPAQ